MMPWLRRYGIIYDVVSFIIKATAEPAGVYSILDDLPLFAFPVPRAPYTVHISKECLQTMSDPHFLLCFCLSTVMKNLRKYGQV